MTTLRLCIEYLNQHHVRHAHSTHPVAYTARDVAAAEHVPLNKLAKTVIFLGEHGYGMAVLPADGYVELEDLRVLLGVHQVRLATEEEIGLLFPGCELGAMPPFGSFFGLPVYVDRSLEDEEFIAFNAGTHRDLIHMEMRDFVRLVKPVVGDFACWAQPSRR